MKTLFRIIILLLSLTLIQCSSDDNSTNDTSLTVNGVEFKLANNSGNKVYNLIKSKSDNSIRLSISEKTASGELGRSIQLLAIHEAGSATGTYALHSNMIEPGSALLTMYDADDTPIAGSSDDHQPTGTVSIHDMGSNRYQVTFNNVVLDPETGTQTNIAGTCTKTFKFVAGN